MTEHDPSLICFGRRIAELQDEQLDQTNSMSDLRGQLFETVAIPRRSSRHLGWVAALAAAACVLLVVAWFLSQPSAMALVEPATYEVDGLAASSGQPVLAQQDHGALMRFSDGSTVLLQPQARARVVSLETNAVVVEMEQGNASVHVVPHEGATWRLRAGPFVVAVKGTRFDLDWNPNEKKLLIGMHEGQVGVSGCSLGAVTLSAGQHVGLRCVDGSAELSMDVLRATASSTLAPSAASGSSKPAVVGSSPEVVPASPSWRILASKGKHKEAFDTVERIGFERVCAQTDAPGVLLLADAALYSGHSGQARQALLAVRRRFPGSASAAIAAFKLGRIAFDGQGAYAEARRWFNTYLQEPHGTYSREALGRLMEVEHRTGNRAAACTVGRTYLDRYPTGPHARLAHQLLDEDASNKRK